MLKKQKVEMIDCSTCSLSIKYKNEIHCKLRIKSNIPSQYSKVTKVTDCSWNKLKK